MCSRTKVAIFSQKPITIKHIFRANKNFFKHHNKSIEWYLFMNIREAPIAFIHPASLKLDLSKRQMPWHTTTAWKVNVTYPDHIGYKTLQHLQQQNRAENSSSVKKRFQNILIYKFKMNTIKKFKATMKHEMSYSSIENEYKIIRRKKKMTRNTSCINCRLTYCTASTTSVKQTRVKCTERILSKKKTTKGLFGSTAYLQRLPW